MKPVVLAVVSAGSWLLYTILHAAGQHVGEIATYGFAGTVVGVSTVSLWKHHARKR